MLKSICGTNDAASVELGKVRNIVGDDAVRAMLRDVSLGPVLSFVICTCLCAVALDCSQAFAAASRAGQPEVFSLPGLLGSAQLGISRTDFVERVPDSSGCSCTFDERSDTYNLSCEVVVWPGVS